MRRDHLPVKGAVTRSRATNVTLDSALVAEAKELGINISQACEKGLADVIFKEKMRRWNEENRDSIEAWNTYVEEHGLPFAEYRQF